MYIPSPAMMSGLSAANSAQNSSEGGADLSSLMSAFGGDAASAGSGSDMLSGLLGGSGSSLLGGLFGGGNAASDQSAFDGSSLLGSLSGFLK